MMGGMRAGIAAVVCDVALKMGTTVVKQKNILSIIVMPVAFAANYFFKVKLIYIILTCAAISLAAHFIGKAVAKKKAAKEPLTAQKDALPDILSETKENTEEEK